MEFVPTAAKTTPIRPQDTRYEERVAAATDAAARLDREVLLGAEATVLVDAIVSEHAARLVEPLWDTFFVNLDDQQHLVVGLPESPEGVDAFRVEMWMTFRGATDSVRGFWTNGSNEGCAPDEMKFSWQRGFKSNSDEYDVQDAKKLLEQLRDWWFPKIHDAVDAANKEIGEHRAKLRAEVLKVVAVRQSRAQAFADASNALAIPLNPTAEDVSASIPLRPKALRLSDVEAAAHDGASEAALTVEVADALVKQIAAFGAALERLPASANRLAGQDEESLRDVLLFVLNANWQGGVTGETFVGQGKTDIHLTWRGKEAFIGECKFWHGEQKFREALDQLLDRYTVWRATRVALVLFIRDIKDVTSVIDKAWRCIQDHARYTGETTAAAPDLNAALMKAQTDAARLVTLTLLPVVIPQAIGE